MNPKLCHPARYYSTTELALVLEDEDGNFPQPKNPKMAAIDVHQVWTPSLKSNVFV